MTGNVRRAAVGKIDAICTSKEKGVRKTPVDRARFVAGQGVEGDAHCGRWHRQVSLLGAEHIDTVRRGGLPDVSYGDFAENLVVSGISLASLGLGSRLKLGSEVELRITQIGKVCHMPCRIHQLTGDCIMPSRGLFARVESGGNVSVGDSVEVTQTVPREYFQVVVLTISDRCSRGQASDKTGPAIAKNIEDSLDAHVYVLEILPDDITELTDRLRHYSGGHSIDLILTAGGTGFSARDHTPEATRVVVERLTPGLDEAMRALSLKKTPHAILSRSCSGIRGSTLMVNLPGSERAAMENLDAIMAALPHGLRILRGEETDCGRSPGK